MVHMWNNHNPCCFNLIWFEKDICWIPVKILECCWFYSDPEEVAILQPATRGRISDVITESSPHLQFYTFFPEIWAELQSSDASPQMSSAHIRLSLFVSSSRWSQQRWTRGFSQTATAKCAALSSSPSPSGSPIMRWGRPLTWPPATFHTLSDWMRGSRPPERLHGSQHLSPAADSHTTHLSGATYLFHQTLMMETEE